MIKKAQEQYSNIEFRVCDALELPLLDYIYKVLKPKGLLICEFGTSGNIATIENAFIKVCQNLIFQQLNILRIY